MAAAGIIPLAMAWIGDNVSYEQRQEVLARLLSATVFGMIAGQWLGGLAAQAIGWRAAFGVLALVFLVAGAGLLLHSRQLGPDAVRAPGSVVRQMRELVARPWARTVLWVTAVEGALAYSALAFVPTNLHARFGLGMTEAGGIAALYGVGGLLYSRSARPLLRRLGEPGLAALGGASLAVAFLTIAWTPVWQPSLPACLLAGFGFYALHNTLQTHATQMAPAVRGTAVSLFVCMLFLGQSAGTLAASWMVDHYSVAAVFVVAALGLLAIGFAFARLVARVNRRNPACA